MMSSWRSGRVISWTACLSGCSPKIRTKPTSVASATAKRTRRRRTFALRRSAALGRRARELVALAVPILSQLFKHVRQLGLQLFNGPVVVDDEVRSLGLFVL